MSIITTKIKLKPLALSGETTGATIINQYANIQFGLSSDDSFLGFQQEIDRLTSFTSIDLINPVIDEERRKYKPSVANTSINFYFYDTVSGLYNTQFTTNGFTSAEATENSNNFLNSFFIIDAYNNYDVNNQTKLFTNYLTKKGINNNATYVLTPTNQFYYWYIPISYINLQTGTTSNIYAKYMFYNAKTGKVVPFYNKENENASNSSRIHFKIELNHIDRTWKFISTSILPNYNVMKPYEITNAQFTNRVNNTVGNTLNTAQQNPPSGNTFTTVSGAVNYLTT